MSHSPLTRSGKLNKCHSRLACPKRTETGALYNQSFVGAPYEFAKKEKAHLQPLSKRSSRESSEKNRSDRAVDGVSSLDEAKAHREFPLALSVMDKVKKHSLLEKSLDDEKTGKIRQFFENDMISPSYRVLAFIHEAMNRLWERLMDGTDKFNFTKEIQMLLCEKEKSTARSSASDVHQKSKREKEQGSDSQKNTALSKASRLKAIIEAAFSPKKRETPKSDRPPKETPSPNKLKTGGSKTNVSKPAPTEPKGTLPRAQEKARLEKSGKQLELEKHEDKGVKEALQVKDPNVDKGKPAGVVVQQASQGPRTNLATSPRKRNVVQFKTAEDKTFGTGAMQGINVPRFDVPKPGGVFKTAEERPLSRTPSVKKKAKNVMSTAEDKELQIGFPPPVFETAEEKPLSSTPSARKKAKNVMSTAEDKELQIPPQKLEGVDPMLPELAVKSAGVLMQESAGSTIPEFRHDTSEYMGIPTSLPEKRKKGIMETAEDEPLMIGGQRNIEDFEPPPPVRTNADDVKAAEADGPPVQPATSEPEVPSLPSDDKKDSESAKTEKEVEGTQESIMAPPMSRYVGVTDDNRVENAEDGKEGENANDDEDGGAAGK
ncbi:unnamed protein product [Nippostrongylus brasiliensis]|uniref:INCENP_ARK-bind domain-containing protein n=1 Tax=Nippostrongylus brasiliensis TaxID=27835 RepID=A0A0N4YDT0_NIPBR|nr:unnamed protein product [Nippostrongylus brasiliensis]